MPTQAEVRDYITRAAELRGIPAALAVSIAGLESGLSWDSQGDWWVSKVQYPTKPINNAIETATGWIVPKGFVGAVPTSFGPFQLRAGRKVTGNAAEAGLGDGAINAGIDVRDPATWRQQIDFALNWAADRGTFAGTWSTAVGDLARSFSGGHAVAIGSPLPGAAPVADPPGAPAVPGMPEPGAPAGPAPAPATPFPEIKAPDPLGGFADSLGGVAAAIGQLPAAIATPFVTAIQQAYATMAWLGQVHIWERIGLVLLGAVTILVGLVLLALSFWPKERPLPVPV